MAMANDPEIRHELQIIEKEFAILEGDRLQEIGWLFNMAIFILPTCIQSKVDNKLLIYSHKDSEWVHGKLLSKLERHGFSVLIDTYFEGGRFDVMQMEDGVMNSKRVIAVFTNNYFERDLATLENVMAQILDPATKKRKLIPILYKSCDIPLRLKGLHPRDLRSNDKHEWHRLIQDLML